ncbi:MAG: endonuclease MutS2 [Pyrinomonadaceae bacterium]|nr:MAG: endonuclease MutS2 [Pyrinomonadaceae bacterium]
MKDFSLETLEYNELLELIAENAQTPLGKKRVLDLKPFQNLDALKNQLQALKEITFLINENHVRWEFSDIFDPSEAISILKIQNASLGVHELSRICHLCKMALSLRAEIESFKADTPTLWEKAKKLPTSLTTAIQKIERAILPNGEISDLASPELSEIRREILRQRERLIRMMERIIRSAGDAIQDTIITQRNERFVIPVKADFRGSLQGVTHGFSSSGATAFVEPLEAIELNNELQILREREEQEIKRILFNLTEILRHELAAVEIAVHLVTEFDFMKAKAEFARKFDAIVPEVSREETLLLDQARHPLLEKNLRENGQRIVPVSFSLTKEKPAMIISGANAGGKTVVLKTAGLLSLMALSGLPVTAKIAKIPFYRSVLADIGDHQSISANLSTFTSHISSIAEIIKTLETTEGHESPALVLLDEVGTGTDPEEGAALGVAIVEYLHRKYHTQLMASTHYKSLKVYAASNPDVTNASVEFDEKTLQPTYRLLIGVAGASSGIEIARRFGLPDEIVEKAKEELEVSTQKINDYLTKLKNEYKLAEDLRLALEEERKATAEKYELLETEFTKKEHKRQQEFAAKLKETIESFERQAKAFIESLEDKATKAKLEKQLAAQKAEVKKRAIHLIQEMKGDGEKTPSVSNSETLEFFHQEIKAGMKVLVKSLNRIGKVEKIEGQMAKVLIGSMRINEKLENLQAVTEEKSEKPKSKEVLLRLETENRSAELNLIGKTTFEIEDEIDKFLDKSYMSGFKRVRIIHGIGTGALRQAVRKFLKDHPHVERFTPAAQDQGGDGATIVELKS